MQDTLIAKIKQKKELKGIPDAYIAQVLLKKFPQRSYSTKDERLIIKTIRQALRTVTGQYRTKQDAHVSTNERTDFYPTLNKRIDLLAPKRILDLGCGQNPLFQARKGMTYYAYDLNEQDLAKVQTFCTEQKIQGIVKVCDITQEKVFPPVDLVIAYKVLDIIDTTRHTHATRILRSLNTTFLLASFPTRTLAGKKMNVVRRRWFEKALLTNGYTYETFTSSNELFYLCRWMDKVPRTI